MKVVITGASGMVGWGVLLECLDSETVTKVLLVNRKHVEISHPKLEELLIPDFATYKDEKHLLAGYDACFFCAGITSAGKTEDQFTKQTYDVAVNIAKEFHVGSSGAVYCYVSGAGTDSTEKGRIMWARVKGRTENAIAAMGFKVAYMFRPGFIQPMRGIKSKTKLYAFIYLLFSPLYWLLFKHIPGAATSSVNMGRAMINAALHKSSKTILGNRDINTLAKK